jgi:hypothetical protein
MNGACAGLAFTLYYPLWTILMLVYINGSMNGACAGLAFTLYYPFMDYINVSLY